MKRVVPSALALLVLLSGCDNAAPGGPSPPTPPGQSSNGLQIVGPDSVAPGGSAQLTVVERLPDGTTRPLSAVQWSSSNVTVLRVSASGLASAQSVTGESTIQADVQDPSPPSSTRRVSREILVLPEGTFRLVGTVRDAALTSVVLPGTRLEVRLDADLAAPIIAFATTNNDGLYRLYGVPGHAFLHLRRADYRSVTMPVQLTSHATRHFDLDLLGERLSLPGSYTMTVLAGNQCAVNPLRVDLRQRTYTADITQSGAWVTVTLGGAPFAVVRGMGNRFSGIASNLSAHVRLWDFRTYYYYENPEHPDVVEILPDGTVLVVTGTANLSETSTGFAGSFNGAITQYDNPDFPRVRHLAACSTTSLTLVRR